MRFSTSIGLAGIELSYEKWYFLPKSTNKSTNIIPPYPTTLSVTAEQTGYEPRRQTGLFFVRVQLRNQPQRK
jgi:hypothetical protein